LSSTGGTVLFAGPPRPGDQPDRAGDRPASCMPRGTVKAHVHNLYAKLGTTVGPAPLRLCPRPAGPLAAKGPSHACWLTGSSTRSPATADEATERLLPRSVPGAVTDTRITRHVPFGKLVFLISRTGRGSCHRPTLCCRGPARFDAPLMAAAVSILSYGRRCCGQRRRHRSVRNAARRAAGGPEHTAERADHATLPKWCTCSQNSRSPAIWFTYRYSQ